MVPVVGWGSYVGGGGGLFFDQGIFVLEVFVDLGCLEGFVHGAGCFVLLLWFLHLRILYFWKVSTYFLPAV